MSRAEGDDALRYCLVLKIAHPSADPGQFSSALHWEPRISWRVGDERVTPAGTPLGGIRAESFWSGSEYEEGHPEFMRNVVEIIDHIEPRAALLKQVVCDGGELILSVHLHGGLPIGDTIGAEDLVRMARMGIDLALGNFPDFNREPL